ncbi:MAG: hypothetical protein R6V49_00190 [Bacteroidales bacterium]
MENGNKTERILNLLRDKSLVKFQVHENTLKAFRQFKSVGKTIYQEIKTEASSIHKNITCSFQDKGDFEAEIKIASDLILLTMHTNTFEFPRDHAIMKTSYVTADESRSYCGIIYIYNYLADSFKYNRLNDVGYLVGRIFINKENHFFVEGKRELGFMFNNFMGEPLDKTKIRQILESAILYSIDFDLLTPTFDQMKEVTLQEMISYSNSLTVRTGKRLGFRFEADRD